MSRLQNSAKRSENPVFRQQVRAALPVRMLGKVRPARRFTKTADRASLSLQSGNACPRREEKWRFYVVGVQRLDSPAGVFEKPQEADLCLQSAKEDGV